MQFRLQADVVFSAESLSEAAQLLANHFQNIIAAGTVGAVVDPTNDLQMEMGGMWLMEVAQADGTAAHVTGLAQTQSQAPTQAPSLRSTANLLDDPEGRN